MENDLQDCGEEITGTVACVCAHIGDIRSNERCSSGSSSTFYAYQDGSKSFLYHSRINLADLYLEPTACCRSIAFLSHATQDMKMSRKKLSKLFCENKLMVFQKENCRNAAAQLVKCAPIVIYQRDVWTRLNAKQYVLVLGEGAVYSDSLIPKSNMRIVLQMAVPELLSSILIILKYENKENERSVRSRTTFRFWIRYDLTRTFFAICLRFILITFLSVLFWFRYMGMSKAFPTALYRVLRQRLLFTSLHFTDQNGIRQQSY